jgi:DNA-binding NarL/FixJ family response regulator
MDKKRINIAILENASIISEGIQSLLQKSHLYIKPIWIKDIDNLSFHIDRLKIDMIMINPNLIINRLKFFTTIKNSNPQVKWFALTYNLIDKELQPFFDDIIQIDDMYENITRKIDYFIENTQSEESTVLTDREQNVLKEIIKGLSNKEIAERLNISIHTVMSHRKNIYQKTDIKSQAGLTVYALTHNIVTLENM